MDSPNKRQRLEKDDEIIRRINNIKVEPENYDENELLNMFHQAVAGLRPGKGLIGTPEEERTRSTSFTTAPQDAPDDEHGEDSSTDEKDLATHVSNRAFHKQLSSSNPSASSTSREPTKFQLRVL